jgi:iron-sulfur cluster insertion protein
LDEQDTPITLTDKAAEKILETRTAENVAVEKVLRLAVRGGGCAGFTYEFYFDDPDPDIDRRFLLKGVDLVIDHMSLMYLAGTEIDYVEGLNESGFKFNNPHAKSTCGCGSSFSA